MIICGLASSFLTFIFLKMYAKSPCLKINVEKQNLTQIFVAIVLYFMSFVFLFHRQYGKRQDKRKTSRMIELEEKRRVSDSDEKVGLLREEEND